MCFPTTFKYCFDLEIWKLTKIRRQRSSILSYITQTCVPYLNLYLGILSIYFEFILLKYLGCINFWKDWRTLCDGLWKLRPQDLKYDFQIWECLNSFFLQNLRLIVVGFSLQTKYQKRWPTLVFCHTLLSFILPLDKFSTFSTFVTFMYN